MLESLEHFKNLKIQDNKLADIYDGDLWKRLHSDDDIGTFSFNNIPVYLSLNFDFFQCYDADTYKVGGIVKKLFWSTFGDSFNGKNKVYEKKRFEKYINLISDKLPKNRAR
eukprot:Pgem_evm1s12334